MIINPRVVFEDAGINKSIITIQQTPATVIAGATADGVLVNGVAGQIIRVLTLNVKATTATVDFTLRSKPTGASTRMFSDFAVYQVRNYWSEYKIGLCDTAVGDSLTAGVAAAGNAEFSIRYIMYIP